jgi:predicted phosphoribosyltransferase
MFEPASVRFHDRADAGRELACALSHRRRSDAVVLGLARGGVPIAYEIARAIGLPLDVLTVRKLGLPGQPELAMGAIASGDVVVWNEEVIRAARLRRATLERVAASAAAELTRRERAYRVGAPMLAVAGHAAIVVDDGLATGSSMLAAVESLRRRGAHETVVAVPVAPAEARATLAGVADEVVCLFEPRPFFSVGAWYGDFRQTSDAKVRELLTLARSHAARPV